jgi:hypothetical protein
MLFSHASSPAGGVFDVGAARVTPASLGRRSGKSVNQLFRPIPAQPNHNFRVLPSRVFLTWGVPMNTEKLPDSARVRRVALKLSSVGLVLAMLSLADELERREGTNLTANRQRLDTPW